MNLKKKKQLEKNEKEEEEKKRNTEAFFDFIGENEIFTRSRKIEINCPDEFCND